MTRALVVVVALVAELAAAQVTNNCGPGKTCSVRNLNVTGQSGLLPPPLCLSSSSPLKWGWSISGTAANFNAYTSVACNGAGTAIFGYDSSAGKFASYNSIPIEGAGGFSASVAFAAFPTCDATTRGRIIYDSTNTRWRECSTALSGWVASSPLENSQTIYSPANVVTNNTIARWSVAPARIAAPVGTTTAITSATVLTAGVGAGNITFTVYDVTGAGNTSATVTFACTAAAGTVTVGSTDATVRQNPNVYELRVTASACSTNPVVNVNVRNIVY